MLWIGPWLGGDVLGVGLVGLAPDPDPGMPRLLSLLVLLDIDVNGEFYSLDVDPAERLLSTLRDRLGLRGTKEACGRGECGSCTVLVDGRPYMACLTLTRRVRNVETIEGLADEMLPLRDAFARLGAFQCGFCTPGQIVRAAVLVRDGRVLDENEIRDAMSGNICRCTGYQGIVHAIHEVLISRVGDDRQAGDYDA
jgi:aerobic-type carbon monoxide dehydrogenase small subunit (CoxS/CutS family)